MFLITNVTSVLINIVVTNVVIFVENQNILCKTLVLGAWNNHVLS